MQACTSSAQARSHRASQAEESLQGSHPAQVQAVSSLCCMGQRAATNNTPPSDSCCKPLGESCWPLDPVCST